MADYATEEELLKIEKWDWQDPEGLLNYVHSLWQYADDGFWREKNGTYKLATAGWSGNEEIIGAMRHNYGFWVTCWVATVRGGLHVFKLPKKKRG